MTDPTCINPELGGEEGFRRLAATLRSLNLGILLDIVPNHMAACADNAWWWDVQKNGRESRFAKFFDIDWERDNPELRGKLLLPVLGASFDEVLARGELQLDEHEGEYVLRYFDRRFPISPRDRAEIEGASLGAYDCATESGRQKLGVLLSRQHYRLAWWRLAADEINWRRFFDVNDLVALDMREDEAFEKVHELPFRLYEEGLIDGVRVDHVDGLADPGGYCRALRVRLRALQDRRPPAAPAGPPYILVEKILLSGETLPPSWETDGTSGYDFMDEVSLLQHDEAAETQLSEAWAEISGRSPDFAEEEERARRQILALSFSGHLEACAACFHRLARAQSPRPDVSLAALRRVLTELLAHFPIYRLYGPSEEAREHDRPFLEAAFAKARASVLPPDRFALDLLQAWLSEPLQDEAGHLQKEAVTRFQQLSAPVAAKAVEDTAGYRYGRLISRNDVGFDMARLGAGADEFHKKMVTRLQDYPNALLATATHDHKRGEDVRARLAVLSECPDDWTLRLRRWIARSRSLRNSVAGSLAPIDGDLAILFQTLVGSWPLDLLADGHLRPYAERIAAWLEKASREAKLNTDWIVPNEAYEQAARAFVMRLLVERADPDLLAEIAAFARRIAPAGAVNGLAQTVLKLTVPGVPDLYQGTDYWDFSLVDPDNRRPVDFAARIASLERTPLENSAENWRSGAIKQHIIAHILALRKQAPDLFAKGDYRPLEIGGRHAENLVAFTRTLGEARLFVIVPQLTFSLLGESGGIGFEPAAWEDSWIGLDAPPDGDLLEILTRRRIAPAHRLPVAKLLQELPVAVLSNVSHDLH